MVAKRARLKTAPSRLSPAESKGPKPLPKAADEIYGTAEYAAWRNTVIRRAHARCEWPGCDRREPRMYADHIVELRDGGAPFDPDNGQCLCGSHHTIKTNQQRAKRMAQKF